MSNRNVTLGLAFTFLGAAARGIWAFTTLSNYLQGVTNSVFSVGLAEGVQGVSQALMALLAGWYADKFSRDTVLKIAGLLGLLTICFLLIALFVPGWDFHAPGEYVWSWMDSSVRYRMFVAALACWGGYQGVWNTSLETIFADSIPLGKRSFYNTRKFMLQLLASISGPVAAIVLFLAMGNNWDLRTLTFVFAGGLVATIPSIVCLFFFRDDMALPEGNRERGGVAGHSSTLSAQEINSLGDIARDNENIESSSSPSRNTAGALKLPCKETPRHWSISGDNNSANVGKESGSLPRCSRCLCVSSFYVPHVIVGSDLISGFGSGMTVKFFPLFFSKKLKLSPVSTNSIYIAVPLFMMAASFLAQKLSLRFGRVQISILYAYVGTVALIGMWVVGRSSNDDWEHVSGGVVLPLYFFSTVQHCVRPLKKSILMDFVPKERRARWNSLDSVTRFGWSGSAVVGGWIVDHLNYGWSFFITAVIQFISASILAVLLDTVPLEKIDSGLTNRHAESPASRSSDLSMAAQLVDPLLASIHNEGISADQTAVSQNRTNRNDATAPVAADSQSARGLTHSWSKDSRKQIYHKRDNNQRSLSWNHTQPQFPLPRQQEKLQLNTESIVSEAVYDALAAMQSPLMNAFHRQESRSLGESGGDE